VNNGAVNTTLLSRLDDLMEEMQQLQTELSARTQALTTESGFKEIDTRLMYNLEDCIRSAEMIVCSSSTIINSQSTAHSHSARGMESRSQSRAPNSRIEDWITGLTIPEDQNEDVVSSSAVTSTVDLTPPTPGLTNLETASDVGSINTAGRRQLEPQLDYFSAVEPQLVQYWLECGVNEGKRGNYINAIDHLVRALDRGRIKYGGQFEGKEAAMKLLSTYYGNLGQWDNAALPLLELYQDLQGKPLEAAEIEDWLVDIYLKKSDLSSAEKFCQSSLQRKVTTLTTRERKLSSL
jgi:hypothetical protein